MRNAVRLTFSDRGLAPKMMAAMAGSGMLRAAFGDDVVDHYHRCAAWELEEFDRAVTDYEIARGFEKA